MKDSTLAILIGGAALALGLHVWSNQVKHEAKRCIRHVAHAMCDGCPDDLEVVVVKDDDDDEKCECKTEEGSEPEKEA